MRISLDHTYDEVSQTDISDENDRSYREEKSIEIDDELYKKYREAISFVYECEEKFWTLLEEKEIKK